jgi:hypothetical protein
MFRRLFTIVSALSAALFLALLLVWVLRLRMSWEAAGPQWGFTFVVHHYTFRTMPDLMVGVRPLFLFTVAFVVPMALALILPGLWAILVFLRRRRPRETAGFPLDARDPSAAS